MTLNRVPASHTYSALVNAASSSCLEIYGGGTAAGSRELRHSFVSLLSDHDIPLERIALLVGHSSQATTEAVYRKQFRPVITQGAEAMDDIFAEDQEGEDAEGEEESDAVA